jgi:hypothetical protein
LHTGNIACEIPSIGDHSADDILEHYDDPDITVVIARDLHICGEYLPKYVVEPISMLDFIVQPTRIPLAYIFA